MVQEEPPGDFALAETFTLTLSLTACTHPLGRQLPPSLLSSFQTKHKPELEAGAARQGQLPSGQVATLLNKGCATAALRRAFRLRPAACPRPARRR